MLRRYALEDSDGLRYFTWDNSGTKLLDERDISGNVTAYYTHGYSYVPGIGTMIAAKKQESSATYYQFGAYDHRGSVYRLTNEDNEIVATYEYNAFGEPLQNQETGATNRYMYQSDWISLKDSGDEIVLSPSRLYSTATGQFLQKDFLLQMTLLMQKGTYWNSIFRGKQRNLFRTDNYGLYQAFKSSSLRYTDSLGLIIFEPINLFCSLAYAECVVRSLKAIKYYLADTVEECEKQGGELNYTICSTLRYSVIGVVCTVDYDHCVSNFLTYESSQLVLILPCPCKVCVNGVVKTIYIPKKRRFWGTKHF